MCYSSPRKPPSNLCRRRTFRSDVPVYGVSDAADNVPGPKQGCLVVSRPSFGLALHERRGPVPREFRQYHEMPEHLGPSSRHIQEERTGVKPFAREASHDTFVRSLSLLTVFSSGEKDAEDAKEAAVDQSWSKSVVLFFRSTVFTPKDTAAARVAAEMGFDAPKRVPRVISSDRTQIRETRAISRAFEPCFDRVLCPV